MMEQSGTVDQQMRGDRWCVWGNHLYACPIMAVDAGWGGGLQEISSTLLFRQLLQEHQDHRASACESFDGSLGLQAVL
jgi:hypothetical protein